MKRRTLVSILVVMLSIGFVTSPFSLLHSVSSFPTELSPPLFSPEPQGIVIESNGTVVVSGNASLSGSQMSLIYDGHGAFFVSGDFIIESSAVLHVFNLSIVFTENAVFINNGRLYLNNSIITVYNLSMNGIPDLNFRNNGHIIGNSTSFEFPGFFNSSLSTAIFSGGYFGKGSLSFHVNIVGSILVLSEEKVYGSQMLGTSNSLGYGNLVSMNISGSTLYSYNSFFNLIPPKLIKQPSGGNKTNNTTNSYSSLSGKYSGGYINMVSSSAYLLNFSMVFNSSTYENSGYVFPIFGDLSSSAYFFDSDTISVVSPSGYPVYNVPFQLSETYSSYVSLENTIFRNISYTREYAPFPHVIGPVTTVYGLVDVYNGSGLYTFNYYGLSVMKNNFTVQYPALPLFRGDPANITVNVPTVYFQLSALNLTHSMRSGVTLNYSVLYGSVNGEISVDLNNTVVYTYHLSGVAGNFGSIKFGVTPVVPAGEYEFNVTMSGGSYFSYNELSIPVIVYQDMRLNLTVGSTYKVTGETPDFTTIANVTVFVNASGNFNPTYGNLFLEIYNGSSYLNYSDYISLHSGGNVSVAFPVPASMLLSHEIDYTASIYPGSSYTQKTVYLFHLNQSLLASLAKVKYSVVGDGIGSAVLDLNFSISSLTAENSYAIYLNGIRQLSGFSPPGWTNVSIPSAVGKNSVSLELNGQNQSASNSSSSWNIIYDFYKVSIDGSVSQFMTYGYPPFIYLNVSAVGAPSSSMLAVYLNGSELPFDGASMKVSGVSNVNNVSVYENILGDEVLVAERAFTSQIVFPPSLVPISSESIIGIYHASISFRIPSNVSISNVTMEGSGAAYNSTIVNGTETFNFSTHFSQAGMVDRILIVNGTIHGLPFSVDVTVLVKVGYPSIAVEYIGSHVIEYGTKTISLKEVNLDHTGTFTTLTVIVTGNEFSKTYTLVPNAQGVIIVPVPSGLGGYSLLVQYPLGISQSSESMKDVFTVSLFALPLWADIGIVAAIVAIGAFFGYRILTPLLERKTWRRTVKCSNCKRDVPYDADKCPYCGKRFTDKMYCEECGAEIPRISDYCPYCGNVFDKELKLAEWLKKKYRQHILESRKEMEKILGKLGDSDFWRMVIQGNKTVDVETFDVFRSRYIFSGNFSKKGIAVCPVCGSGIMLTDSECTNCHVKMELILNYFANEKEVRDSGTKHGFALNRRKG